MGLFRSKSETYPEAAIAADIERGLIARYLARIFERRQADMLGIAEDADRVIALIAEISRTKPGNPRSSIGFVRQPQGPT